MSFTQIVSQGVQELLGRASGPLHFRLVMMPTMVTILAIRAGFRDAREGRPPFLWGLITRPAERSQLLRSALADIGRVMVMATLMDCLYQLFFLREFHLIQLLIVVFVCAVLPYIAFRGLVTRMVRIR